MRTIKRVKHVTTKHKIHKCSNALCAMCFQRWEGECRAFEMAHSPEERSFRMRAVIMLCDPIKVPPEKLVQGPKVFTLSQRMSEK